MATRTGKNTTASPVKTGISPVGYCRPPAEHRFKPGCKGGPGRRATGATLRNWWAVMGHWPLARLAAVADNPRSPAVKVAAARTMLLACSTECTAAGQPVAGYALDRIIGKPKRYVVQAHVVASDPAPAVGYDPIARELRAIGFAPST